MPPVDVPSKRPLLEKLGLRGPGVLGLLSPPSDWPARLGPLPGHVTVTLDQFGDVTLAFVRTFAELDAALARWPRVTPKPAPSHWVAWAKKSSPLAGEVDEDLVRSRVLACGLVDNKVCRIDADWSGLRIAVRR